MLKRGLTYLMGKDESCNCKDCKKANYIHHKRERRPPKHYEYSEDEYNGEEEYDEIEESEESIEEIPKPRVVRRPLKHVHEKKSIKRSIARKEELDIEEENGSDVDETPQDIYVDYERSRDPYFVFEDKDGNVYHCIRVDKKQ